MRASPTADRDLALMGLFVALLGVLAAIATALMLGAAVTTSLLGGPWAMPGVDTWLSGVLGVLGHPGSPGAGLGPPTAGRGPRRENRDAPGPPTPRTARCRHRASPRARRAARSSPRHRASGRWRSRRARPAGPRTGPSGQGHGRQSGKPSYSRVTTRGWLSGVAGRDPPDGHHLGR